MRLGNDGAVVWRLRDRRVGERATEPTRGLTEPLRHLLGGLRGKLGQVDYGDGIEARLQLAAEAMEAKRGSVGQMEDSFEGGEE